MHSKCSWVLSHFLSRVRRKVKFVKGRVGFFILKLSGLSFAKRGGLNHTCIGRNQQRTPLLVSATRGCTPRHKIPWVFHGEMIFFAMASPAEISGHFRKTVSYYFFLVRPVPFLVPFPARPA